MGAWVPSVAPEPPWIALGLAGNLNGDNAVVRQAVGRWLEAGGRAVDAALMYYNDEGLRQGLEGFYTSDSSDPSDPSASEVFVTTKIPPEQMGFDGTLKAILEAREKILPAGRLGAVQNVDEEIDRFTSLRGLRRYIFEDMHSFSFSVLNIYMASMVKLVFFPPLVEVFETVGLRLDPLARPHLAKAQQ